jgi:hypothetical protein
MIKVQLKREPEGFDEHVRQKGLRWLKEREGQENPSLPSYWRLWTPCIEALEEAFASRCAYSAHLIPSGQVDHYKSWLRCREDGQRHLAYEWKNFRWCLSNFNGYKGAKDVLDPFEVEDDWFEINLFSLNLSLTERVPPNVRPRAEQTLKNLRLVDGRIVRRMRRRALDLYREGTSMEIITNESPIVARALRRLMDAKPEALPPEDIYLRRSLEQARRKVRDRTRRSTSS